MRSMTDTSFKKLEKLIDSVKEVVEITKHKVEGIELVQSVTNGQVRMIKDQQSVMNKKLDELKDVQEERLLPSVVTIENTIKTYSDMYKLNNDNMKKLEIRVETLEDSVGIEPPPELTLAEVK